MWLNIVLSFTSGVGVALFGAIVATIFQRRLERRRKVESERFQVYMKLMELHGLYFWVSSAEVRGQPTLPEIGPKIRDLAWQIADRLRAADQIKDLDCILEVLFSTHYSTARERYHAIDNLLQDLGTTVNPRYAAAIRKISEENVQRTGAGVDPAANTPGFLR